MLRSIFQSEGSQKKNDFGVIYELFNQLKWGTESSFGPQIEGYIVYRNGIKIATLGADTFDFEDRNIKKEISNTYNVLSFDAGGTQSESATITIK